MIEDQIHQWFKQHKKTVAFAESCTGGALAERIVSLVGASEFFLGSCVAYSPQMKQTLLHVSEKTIKAHGAVSRQVAEEMLNGILKVSGADYGIAVTGMIESPRSTLWAAIGPPNRIFTFQVQGDRKRAIQLTVNQLLESLFEILEK